MSYVFAFKRLTLTTHWPRTCHLPFFRDNWQLLRSTAMSVSGVAKLYFFQDKVSLQKKWNREIRKYCVSEQTWFGGKFNEGHAGTPHLLASFVFWSYYPLPFLNHPPPVPLFFVCIVRQWSYSLIVTRSGHRHNLLIAFSQLMLVLNRAKQHLIESP